MFDKSAIDALSAAQAIDAADRAVSAAVNSDGLVALPDDWTKHDLEAWLPNRRRARGTMSTRVLAHLAAYVHDHRETGAAVFVDPEHMRATAVLNLGTPSAPGHADNRAIYAPVRTAAFLALLSLCQRPQGQQALAEWLEDWSDFVVCTNGDTALATKHAVAAVRKVTLEAIQRSENTQEQLSASRSAFESVKASSGDQPLPSHITFACEPYAGLESRVFVARVSVLTEGKAPTFTLRIAKLEAHQEEMAEELAAKVRACIDETPVYVGSYTTVG